MENFAQRFERDFLTTGKPDDGQSAIPAKRGRVTQGKRRALRCRVKAEPFRSQKASLDMTPRQLMTRAWPASRAWSPGRPRGCTCLLSHQAA